MQAISTMYMDLSALLIECANQEGFPLAGNIDIDLAFSDSAQTFQKHLKHYDDWIEAGHAGAMEYLKRGRDRRADPRLLFPEAQSILCVAIPYPRLAAGADYLSKGPRYARYLQGNDYHIEIAERLERAMTRAVQRLQDLQIHPQHQQSETNNKTSLRWKICVDTSAVLERTWAALAGLGWIGKNTLLIHPKLGSYLFLAEVLINQKTGKGPSILPNYCGNCTRCLNACPTQAFKKPGILDSNSCISYNTLEKRQEMTLPEKQRKNLGSWIAGCDICQEVCPFNIKPTREELSQLEKAEIPSNATQLNEWRNLLLETPEQYQLRVKNSAMKRVKPTQFSRNLALVIRNALPEIIQTSSQAELLELASLIQSRFESEKDEIAKKEWGTLFTNVAKRDV